MRRQQAGAGPVRFRLPTDASDAERAQAREYVEAAERARKAGRLSPAGRVTVTGDLARAKDRAASEERARAERAGQPYGADVAAHLPDTTWSGDPHPPEGWGRHTSRINSVLGSQSARYPVGYQPDSFQIEDDDEGHANE